MAVKPVTILCFGNPFLAGDSAAQGISAISIPGIKFVSCNSAEEVLFYLDKPFAIMDVVAGAKKVGLIDSSRVVHSGRISTLHDFDLGYFLKLMAALDGERKVPIIALPSNIPIASAKRELTKLIPTLRAKLA